jgi:hypothetical protein
MHRSFAKLVVVVLSVLIIAVATSSAATVKNGDFEDGTLNGWNVSSDRYSSGWWTIYSGSELPISGHEGPTSIGGSSAVADEFEQMSTTLYQDVALEPGFTHQLNLKYWVQNWASDWYIPTPQSFAIGGGGGQEVVLDVIKPSALPNTTNPSDVLTTVRVPAPGDPVVTDWTDAGADLSAFAGQTVRLRFVSVANNNYMHLGLDNVSITSVDIAAPVLSRLKAAPAAFKTGSAGTSFYYSSTEASTVTASISRLSAGKRSGKKCVKPSKQLAKKKSCSLFKSVGAVAQQATAGLNEFEFNGKIGGKALPVGSYSASFVAVDASGKSSAPVTASFAVLPKSKKKK